jgi:hypothetical protein
MRRFTRLTNAFSKKNRPDDALDFAVLVASENDLVFAGVDLSAYGVKVEDPVISRVIENTCDIIWKRVADAISPEVKTGFEQLDRVVADNRSSLAFRPFQQTEAEKTVQAALKLFALHVSEKLPEAASSENGSSRSGRKGWHESRRIKITDRALQFA